MNKKIILFTVLAGLIAGGVLYYVATRNPENEGAQPAATAQKVYHVGILSGVDAFVPIADSFKQKMTELGYKEGTNVVYDEVRVNADEAATQNAIKKFITENVDLIFTFPTEPAVDAKSMTAGTNIPVVFAFGTIEDVNLVNSVTAPGGNMTGVRYPGPDLALKRLEFLRRIDPALKRLWIIYNPDYPATRSALAALRPATKEQGLELVETTVGNASDIKTALEARGKLKDIGVDGILVMPETTVQSPDGWPLVSKFAADHNLPIAGSLGFEVDAGAILSYAPENAENGQLAAGLANKILKGTPASAIPVVTPESVLRLNYKLIKKLGLTADEGLLSLAKDIIR